MSNPAARALPPSSAPLVTNLTTLTFRLLTHLLPSSASNASIAICAPNIYECLLMAAIGSQDRTLSAFANVLNFNPSTEDDFVKEITELDAYCRSSKGVEFATANSVWYREGFRLEEEWQKRVKGEFAADVGVLEGGAVRKWVAKKMRMEEEEEVWRDEYASVLLMLISCLWFKGMWEVQFDRALTRKGVWYDFEGKGKECEMMSRVGQIEISENEYTTGCILPYSNRENGVKGTPTGDDAGRAQSAETEPPRKPQWEAAIFLPKQTGLEAMRSLITSFAASPAAFMDLLVSRRSRRNRRVALSLPPFSLHAHHDLVPALDALGLRAAFEPSLDFAPLSNTGPLCISTVTHDLFLDVNEAGTEMRAKTVVMTRGVQSSVDMTVDRPFLWVVFDANEGLVLCCAVVGDVGRGGGSRL